MGTNVYITPAAAGLEIVAQIHGGRPYEFSILLLLRDARGDLWAAHDAGCSCPTPFENHTFPTDFTQVRTPDDVRPLLERLIEPGAGDIVSFNDTLRGALA